MATAYDTAILSRALVRGFWPGDDTVGASSIAEASGNALALNAFAAAGTSGNPSIMPGDPSTCLHFGGVNSAGVVANPHTTIAVGSNGVDVTTFTGAGVINVVSTSTFTSSGILLVNTNAAPAALIKYTGTSGGNQFTGCTRIAGSGTMATNGVITDRTAFTNLPGPMSMNVWVNMDNVTGDVNGNNFIMGVWNAWETVGVGQVATGQLTGQLNWVRSGGLLVPNNTYMLSTVFDPLNGVSNLYMNGVLRDSQTERSTTIASGSSGADTATFTGTQTLNVASVPVGMPTTGRVVVATNAGYAIVAYVGTTGTTFTNCYTTSGSGLVATGGMVCQALNSSAFNMEAGGALGTAGAYAGYWQKGSIHADAISQPDLQSLYIVGAMTASEAGGVVNGFSTKNVYQFSRQVAAPNTARDYIEFTNNGDTPIFLSLADTSTPALAGAGPRVDANGGKYRSEVYNGPVQAIHSNYLGAKSLTVEEQVV